MRFFIDLSYHGKAFHGWQKQPNAISVQETVEKSLCTAFQKPIELVGAGRTDTGVHAKQCIAHFDIENPFDAEEMIYKLNTMLPPSIVVNRIFQVKPDVHARFDAVSREYKYYVNLQKDPFSKDFACLIKKKIDVDLMNQGCQILMEHNNFQCFSKVKTDVKTYNCKIEKAHWEKIDDQLVFTIKADRFLRNMVRAIVGTLLEIGTGKRPLSDLEKILASKDRCEAGKSMAAKGLFLYKINYPKNITEK